MQEPCNFFPCHADSTFSPLPAVSFHTKNLCDGFIYICILLKLHVLCMYVILHSILLWFMFYFLPLHLVQCPKDLFMTRSILLVGSKWCKEQRHPFFHPQAVLVETELGAKYYCYCSTQTYMWPLLELCKYSSWYIPRSRLIGSEHVHYIVLNTASLLFRMA